MAYPTGLDKGYLHRIAAPFLQARQGDLFQINDLSHAGFTWAQCYPQKM